MKSINVQLYSGTDHYDRDFGPEQVKTPVEPALRRGGISGFQCGQCKKIFSDPDECMDHFIQSHKESHD